MGMENYLKTKPIDYATVLGENAGFGVYEHEINSQFGVQQTEPAERNCKRVGLMGYKIGMTHYWDRWGKHIPCTVI